MSTWTHPTGQSPRAINLICLGHSHADYVAGCFTPDISPAVRGAAETWTLNRGGMAFRHDLLFVMDHIQGEAESYPHYGAALWRHDRPIITSDNAKGWPAHVHLYPWAEIQRWLASEVKPMHGDWFHNSVSFILVYAAFIGVAEVRIFGADYVLHSSGIVEDGHPNVAYWTGALERVGLCVKPVSTSGFLNANQRQLIYGYCADPRIPVANRSLFQALISGDPAELCSGERQVAANLDGIRLDHRLRYQWAAQRVSGIVLDLGCGVGYGSAILAAQPGVKQVISLDKSVDAVEYAKRNYGRDSVTFSACDFDNPQCGVDGGDYAVAFEIIEHLRAPEILLKDVTARNLLASVPNEAAIPYSPESAPFHFRHYTQEQFERLLTDCGWTAVSWYGQIGIDGPVVDYTPACRTIIVEAERRGTIHLLAGT